MATITTDTFLDDGTTRTAGESWTINGAKLTVRTDSRWHIGAPASMTGTFSTITTSVDNLGFIVDGRNVRWLPYSSGSGVVPAIGTTITQGGVSGYLLGVWAGLTTAPTAVGATVPSTGFIKFREVSGGSFSAGALTGIDATASSADVVGWIEVVKDQATAFGGGSLNVGYTFYGAWFDLGTTTGTPGQIIQLPTNGGGTGTPGIGVQIETAPGSDEYEWYPAIDAAKWTAALVTTDARAKYVQNINSGQMRIGHDGTANTGFTPAAGCKIRIGNIFLRTCTTGARASNTYPIVASRPGLGVNNCNYIFDKVSCEWYSSGIPATSATMTDTIFADSLMVRDFTTVQNCALSSSYNAAAGLTLQSTIGTSIDGLKVAGSSNPICAIGGCSNMAINNLELAAFNTSRLAPVNGISGSGSNITNNLSFTNLKLRSCVVNISYLFDTTFTNIDYIEQLFGDTTAAQGSGFIFFLTACSNVKIDGLTWGMGGVLSGCHPYASQGVVYLNACGDSMVVRNFGAVDAPLPVGATSTTWPGSIIRLNGGSAAENKPAKFQRLFIENTRSAPINAGTTNGIFEQIGYSTNSGSNPPSKNSYHRSLYMNSPLSAATTQGATWWDAFISTAGEGRVALFGCVPGPLFADYTTTDFAPGSTSAFGNTSCRIITANDNVIFETPYFMKGHTGFQNVAPTYTGTNINVASNFDYQIDTGSGWDGTWKSVTAANLSAETVNPTIGFKLKVKVKATSTNISNAFRVLVIRTTTTTAANQVLFYPLDTITLSFEGLQPGSEVRAYVGTDPATAVEIGGIESVSGTTWSFTHSSAGQEGYIAVFALGFNPLIIPRTYASSDSTLLISQVVDRTYVNP